MVRAEATDLMRGFVSVRVGARHARAGGGRNGRLLPRHGDARVLLHLLPRPGDVEPRAHLLAVEAPPSNKELHIFRAENEPSKIRILTFFRLPDFEAQSYLT